MPLGRERQRRDVVPRGTLRRGRRAEGGTGRVVRRDDRELGPADRGLAVLADFEFDGGAGAGRRLDRRIGDRDRRPATGDGAGGDEQAGQESDGKARDRRRMVWPPCSRTPQDGARCRRWYTALERPVPSRAGAARSQPGSGVARYSR